MHRSLFRCLLLVWLLGSALLLCAKTSNAVPSRLTPDLHEVTSRAGIIFAGRVISIEPVRIASSEQIASIQINFQVEQGIRGVRAGQTLACREWAGL